MNEKLNELSIPQSLYCSDVLCKDPNHSLERDSLLIDIMTNVIEATYECLPQTKKVINGTNQNKTYNLPGWDDIVVPARDDSKFWHSVWLSAGKPTTGGLFQVMKWTRNKYHYAVRVCKRKANAIKSVTLGEAAAQGNMTFFKEMKKALYEKSSGQDIPGR